MGHQGLLNVGGTSGHQRRPPGVIELIGRLVPDYCDRLSPTGLLSLGVPPINVLLGFCSALCFAALLDGAPMLRKRMGNFGPH